jgi:TetR/AcrR family transcriptional regulator, cholesterol catabolism regulator
VRRPFPVWRKEDRAEHIYRVAAEIMCERGYEATSMNDIADAVGLTKAGIYHYIRGKEDLLFEIMGYAMDMVDEDVVGPAQGIADAETRLRTIVERHAKRILEVGGAVTILLEETAALTPPHLRVIKSRQRAYFELIRQTLQQLAAEGKLRDVNPTVATFSLLGMILWISRWYHRDGALSADTVLSDFVKCALNAVLNNGASSAPPEVAAIGVADRRKQ